MAQHARSGIDSAATAVLEGRRQIAAGRAAYPVDFGRWLAQMLGAQFRHGLTVGAVLGRMLAWPEVLRAQAELLHASLGHGRRAAGEVTTRSGRRGSTPGRAHERSIRALVRRRGPVVAQPEETVLAATERMAERACGSVLVCDGDRLCGIFTERDLMVRVIRRRLDPGATRLADVMTRDPDHIESTATAQEAARRMDGPAHLLPVTEAGRVLGVLSLHDLPAATVAGVLARLEQRRVLAERMR
ncbi:MAG: cyclic nucleotide-binding/CBS domain-containing protein [Geminicoccaceae bacterium]